LEEEQLKAAQTRLAEAQYDYKIAEVTFAYSTGEHSRRMLKKAVQQGRSR
jgi:hypothetical protein